MDEEDGGVAEVKEGSRGECTRSRRVAGECCIARSRFQIFEQRRLSSKDHLRARGDSSVWQVQIGTCGISESLQ
jgi:hypothetical protein